MIGVSLRHDIPAPAVRGAFLFQSISPRAWLPHITEVPQNSKDESSVGEANVHVRDFQGKYLALSTTWGKIRGWNGTGGEQNLRFLPHVHED